MPERCRATFERGYRASLALGVLAFGALRLVFGGVYVPGASMLEIVSGAAVNPFQQRVLVPAVVRAALLPFGLGGGNVPIAFAAADCFFLAAAVLLLRKLLEEWGGAPRSAIASLALIPLSFWQLEWNAAWRYWYPWDVAAAFFWLLHLYLTLNRRWGMLFAAFVLAAFNRETSLFFIPMTLLFCPTKEGIRVSVLLALLWGGVKISLGVLFAENGGFGALPISLWVNFESLQQISTAWCFATPAWILFAALIVSFVRVRDGSSSAPGPINQTSRAVRRLMCLLGCYFLVMFVTANIRETRALLEIVPLCWALLFYVSEISRDVASPVASTAEL